MSSVALAVTDGIPLFEIAAPCEVFGVDRSYLVEPWYDFTACAPESVQFGTLLTADARRGLDELVAADTVVVPACRSVDEDPPADLVDAVRAAYERGARVASLCTGAFVLAAAGLQLRCSRPVTPQTMVMIDSDRDRVPGVGRQVVARRGGSCATHRVPSLGGCPRRVPTNGLIPPGRYTCKRDDAGAPAE